MSDCTCGHPFGSGECLSAHAQRVAVMEPVPKPVHHHRWLPINRHGYRYCADPTCDEVLTPLRPRPEW